MSCEGRAAVRVAALLVTAVLVGCGGGEMNVARNDAALDAALKTLSAKRVYFGHQSVGEELMAGVGDLVKERGVGPAVVAWRPGTPVAPGTIAHAMDGKNKERLSKIRAFEETMTGPLRDQVDLALFKF